MILVRGVWRDDLGLHRQRHLTVRLPPIYMGMAPPRCRGVELNSTRPAGSRVWHVGHLDVFDGLARPGCVDDLPVAGVEAYMVDVAVKEDQIAQLEIRL